MGEAARFEDVYLDVEVDGVSEAKEEVGEQRPGRPPANDCYP